MQRHLSLLRLYCIRKNIMHLYNNLYSYIHTTNFGSSVSYYYTILITMIINVPKTYFCYTHHWLQVLTISIRYNSTPTAPKVYYYYIMIKCIKCIIFCMEYINVYPLSPQWHYS